MNQHRLVYDQGTVMQTSSELSKAFSRNRVTKKHIEKIPKPLPEQRFNFARSIIIVINKQLIIDSGIFIGKS